MASAILLLALCGLAICVSVVLFMSLWQYTYWKRRKMLHADTFPIIGMNFRVFTRQVSFPDMTKQLYNCFPGAKYFGTFDMGNPVLVISDPEILKDVCIKSFDFFPDHRGFVTEEMDPVIGSNVFSLTGSRWREVRNTLSPTFTATKMKFMFKLIDECSRDFINHFVTNPDLAREFEAKDAFTRYTNDVIATVAFGVQVNSMDDKTNDFYESGKDALDFASFRRVIKFMLFRQFPNAMRQLGVKFLSPRSDAFFKRIVRETVTARDKHGIVRPDMIQLLLQARDKEDGPKFTIDDIVGQAFIFFLAGFDTSATLMCLACHELAANPDIQDRLIAEIDANVPENSEITYESLVGLKYLDMVLNETLRIYPPAVMTDRLCIKEFELPPTKAGFPPYKVPVGTTMLIPIMGLHNDPKYFENPEKFDPERFNDDNKHKIDPFVYVPFGLGPRKCIGNRFALMETKMLIIRILQKFVIEFTDKSEHPLIFSKKKFQLVSDAGFWLRLKDRKKTN